MFVFLSDVTIFWIMDCPLHMMDAPMKFFAPTHFYLICCYWEEPVLHSSSSHLNPLFNLSFWFLCLFPPWFWPWLCRPLGWANLFWWSFLFWSCFSLFTSWTENLSFLSSFTCTSSAMIYSWWWFDPQLPLYTSKSYSALAYFVLSSYVASHMSSVWSIQLSCNLHIKSWNVASRMSNW